MVLRSLYGLWPDSWLRWLRVWVGRTSMGLNFKVFQNTNLLKSKDYILQLAHSEVYRRSSHPRLCSDCPIRNPSPANRATQEPPPQRTKRARRKSSGGAAVDRGRMHQRTWGRMHQRTWGRMHQQTEKDAEADCENSWHGYTIKNRGRPIIGQPLCENQQNYCCLNFANSMSFSERFLKLSFSYTLVSCFATSIISPLRA